VNAGKNVLVTIVNGAAAAVFLIFAHLNWLVVLLIAVDRAAAAHRSQGRTPLAAAGAAHHHRRDRRHRRSQADLLPVTIQTMSLDRPFWTRASLPPRSGAGECQPDCPTDHVSGRAPSEGDPSDQRDLGEHLIARDAMALPRRPSVRFSLIGCSLSIARVELRVRGLPRGELIP
jgi:hypothetical protein